MSRVSRKEDQFFDKFKELAGVINQGAQSYASAARNYPEKPFRITEVKDYEVNCDTLAREIYHLLETSFITPFDREDIAAIIHNLDEIADGMEAVSTRFMLYDIDTARPEAVELAEMTAKATEELVVLFDHFAGFKKDPVVIEKANAVMLLEDQGDILYHNALANIFREHIDPIEVIKWKSLLDRMEETLDAARDVAFAVRSVVMKNA